MSDTSIFAHRSSGRRGPRPGPAVSLGLILFGLSAQPAAAQVELVTGAEIGGSSKYAFISPMINFTSGSPDGKFVVKPSVRYLEYETVGIGGTSTVRAPGGAIGLSYKHSKNGLTVEAGPALEFIKEEERLASGGRIKDDKVGLAISGNVFYQASKFTVLSLLATYSQTSDYFWSRGGAQTRITNRDYSGPHGISIGPEVTLQGGDDLRQYGGGMVLEVSFDRAATSLQVRGGYSRANFSDRSSDSSPYLGAGIYRRF